MRRTMLDEEELRLIRVTFIDIHGARRDLDVAPGQTLMKAAVDHDVSGVLADCGGACSCATCHVHVAEGWQSRLKPATSLETSMLEEAPDLQRSSRLACQIKLIPELDGLLVHVARSSED